MGNKAHPVHPEKQPLISCLCVTHLKPRMLQRVIECFINQTYENKQLVIVYEEEDQATSEFILTRHFAGNIKRVKIESSGNKIPLGELRNISIREADGEYICQWDDDDWYNPDRLSTQMNYIIESGKPACLLSHWIVLIHIQKAYLSNERLWEGSILCKKDLLLQYRYPAIKKGEDSVVIETLYSNDPLCIIDNEPHIYVYNYHGDNTWEVEHFERIFVFSRELPFDYAEEVQEIMDIN